MSQYGANMSDKHSKPVKFDEKPVSRHGIARFGDGLPETITPILDAISAAGWELALHPVNGILDAWLFRTTKRKAEDPQMIADLVMAEIVGKQKPALIIFPPKGSK
jgi:hypothetical protein